MQLQVKQLVELRTNAFTAVLSRPRCFCLVFFGNQSSHRGSTHAFGNTEEHLRRANIGVKAQQGDQRWDNTKGTGAVRAHKGLYHDGIHVKRNEFWLAIAEISGGLNQ